MSDMDGPNVGVGVGSGVTSSIVGESVGELELGPVLGLIDGCSVVSDGIEVGMHG